jgi:hypothetical protein
LRRVDVVVKYFEAETLKPRVLLFHEAKKQAASKSDVKTVELQANDACKTYCESSGFTHVFAMTTVGTSARLWKYESAGGRLTPLFGSSAFGDGDAYIDANSSNAHSIKNGLRHIKAFPPSTYHGQTYSQVGTQPGTASGTYGGADTASGT